MHMLTRPCLTSVAHLMQSPMEAVAQAVLGSCGPPPSPESLEVELVEVEPAQQAGQPQQVSTSRADCCYMHLISVLLTMHVVLLVSTGGAVNPPTLLQLNAAFSPRMLVLVNLLRESLIPRIAVQEWASQLPQQSNGPAGPAVPQAPPQLCCSSKVATGSCVHRQISASTLRSAGGSQLVVGDEQQWPLTAVSTHTSAPEPDAAIELQEQGHEQALLNAIGEQKAYHTSPSAQPHPNIHLLLGMQPSRQALSGLQWAGEATCLSPTAMSCCTLRQGPGSCQWNLCWQPFAAWSCHNMLSR